MNVKGLTRLFIAGATLAALAMAMPAQAGGPYTFQWSSLWTNGGAGGLFYNGANGSDWVLKDTDANPDVPIAKYSFCVDAEGFGAGSYYPVYTTSITASSTLNERKVGWIVQNYLNQTAALTTDGNTRGKQAWDVQRAIWYFIPATGVANYTLGTSDSVDAIIGLANANYGSYSGGAFFIDKPNGASGFQRQVSYVPEAGALQFAAFAGIGALALLRRRRSRK